MEIQKLIEDAVWREYGQKLDDLRRQSDGGVTSNYMVKVVKAVTESALKEVLKQLNIEEQQNEMLIETLEQYKSEIVVLEEWRDRHEDNAVKQFETIKQLEAEQKQLKVENVRLTKKLEYVYNKAYIIYHSANAEKCNSDIIKLWDAVEEFKPIEGAKKYGM